MRGGFTTEAPRHRENGRVLIFGHYVTQWTLSLSVSVVVNAKVDSLKPEIVSASESHAFCPH